MTAPPLTARGLEAADSMAATWRAEARRMREANNTRASSPREGA